MKNWIRYIVLSFAVFSCQNCIKMNEPIVVGHRGAMGHETENTLASIRKALDMGVDMIEIDVFKIKTGEIVVFHDDRLERLSNSVGEIEAYNFNDLKKVVLKGNHQIPTLQEVLNLIDNKVRLNIELKGKNTAEPVNEIVGDYVKSKSWILDTFLISSFKWDELKKTRVLNDNIPIAILTEEDPLGAVNIAKELKAEAINPNFKLLNSEAVAKIHESGFKVYTWTVNEIEDIDLAKKWGVDGIITNFPERVN